MKKARAAGFAVAVVAIVAGILLIPTPLRVQGTLVLTAAKPDEIYAEVEGRLVELNVRDGEWVKKDTVLAELSNPEKQQRADPAAGAARRQLRQGTSGTTRAPSASTAARPRQHHADGRGARAGDRRRSTSRSAS